MTHLVIESQVSFVLFVVSSLVLQGKGASGDISEEIKKEYNLIIDEIQTTLISPEFRVLIDANSVFERINLFSNKHKETVDVSRIIEYSLVGVVGAQGGDVYADLYGQYVMEPCKQIIHLEEKLNDFLDQNPQISTDIFDGSIFILGDLPVLYEDIIEICERGYVRKRVQGQQEYDAILEEIDQLIEETDESVLTEAVRLLDLQSEKSTDLEQTMETSKAIAELLLHVRKIRKVENANEFKVFENIFDSSITQPCDRTIALAAKLNSCLERYPQINDVEHRYSHLPDYFHVVTRICQQLKRDGNQDIFEEFKKLKIQ